MTVEKVRAVAEAYAKLATKFPKSQLTSTKRAAWRSLVQDNPELAPHEAEWFRVVSCDSGGQG